jgi:cysteine desulfurase
MLPFFHGNWGNPSSTYRFGSNLRSALEHSRESVALLIGAHAPEVIFTGCATESNNAAIHAAIRSYPNRRRIVTSAVEHSSILNYCKVLEGEGYSVVYLPVDQSGQLDLDDLRKAVDAETAIVSVMWANNETGVIFPVQEIGNFC